MKKIISILLCVVMVVCTTCTVAFAGTSDPLFTATVDKTAVEAGETFTVKLSLVDGTFASYSMTLSFDTESFRYTGTTIDTTGMFGMFLSNMGIKTLPAEAATNGGKVVLGLTSANDMTYPATNDFATISFTAISATTVSTKDFMLKQEATNATTDYVCDLREGQKVATVTVTNPDQIVVTSPSKDTSTNELRWTVCVIADLIDDLQARLYNTETSTYGNLLKFNIGTTGKTVTGTGDVAFDFVATLLADTYIDATKLEVSSGSITVQN